MKQLTDATYREMLAELQEAMTYHAHRVNSRNGTAYDAERVGDLQSLISRVKGEAGE